MRKFVIAGLVTAGLALGTLLLWPMAPGPVARGVPETTAGSSEPAVAGRDAPAAKGAPKAMAKPADSAAPRAQRIAAAAAPVVPEPLPPLGTPLASNYEQLATRALAGDSKAACRLALDLDECASLPATIAQREALEDMLIDGKVRTFGERTPEQMREQTEKQAARALDGEERIAALCEGVLPTQVDRMQDFLVIAAMAGEKAAVERLLMPYWPGPSERQLAQIQRMVEVAPRVVERELERGNVSVLRQAAHGHAQRGHFLVTPFEHSPVRAYMLNRVHELISGKPEPGHRWVRIRESLAPAERAAADAEALALYERSFRGAQSLPPGDVVVFERGLAPWKAARCDRSPAEAAK